MILQQEVSISPTETAGNLHDKLMVIGSELVIKTVKLIEQGEVKTTPQPENEDIKTAYKLNKENCKIDWHQDVLHIYNKVRGLNPYPSAWSLLSNVDEKLNVKIYEVDKIYEEHELEIGSVIVSKSDVKIAAKNGYIKLNIIKLPGKRKMDIKSLLNGYKFHPDSKML